MADSAPPDLPDEPPPAGRGEEALRLARFFTRLPLPVLAFERAPFAAPDLARATPLLPLVGALVGALGALVGGLAYLAGLSTTLAAILAVATLLIVTGALHEDGFADVCDGFFGGSTPERRLEIMRDSRLGTFGTAGLALTLLVRIFALAELFRLAGPLSLPLLAGVSALARPLALMPALMLPAASAQGLARGVGMPGPAAAGVGLLIGLAIALACAWPAELWQGVLAGGVLAVLAVYGVARLAAARIGGYSGDVFGAAEQVAEVVLLLALAATASGHGPL